MAVAAAEVDEVDGAIEKVSWIRRVDIAFTVTHVFRTNSQIGRRVAHF